MGDTEERLSGLLQGPGFHIPQKLPCQETFRMQSFLNPQHAHKLVRERGRDREREIESCLLYTSDAADDPRVV